ncbi:myotubularin-related protein 9 [Neodiprion pinetum]|uniref:Myotubularin-related protein 9 n=1 Tax=Neodiprion lecontei TaxID=441921 RepID=A0A6J0BQI0_NEOLC|nr:myotubularin-related protein 9 [Neodiprion lecontei]XP_046422886.1 myotubularin-related protein 9 [Neodiprion fabricii]XP_046422887.1 myotubularin-related protein 9 [Neodiprion fabricii]XP_046479076.1 myotubularin-related protein 9 [Neodiprion pinetum]XP_046479077.1 myotubularin-related protein 9 [Neodiprion pinetum]XP_046594211.1 myotubularin-related protein 9 [Neodiprion lecontei]
MELSDFILVTKLDNVVLTDRSDGTDKNSSLDRTLCITGHHLILSSRQAVSQELLLLHRNIDVIEKKSNNQNPGGSIILKCKDFHIYQLDINSTEDLNNVTLSLEKLACLDQPLQYPFFYSPQPVNNSTVQVEDGWTAFAPVSEWSRLLATHADEWRICYLNRDYKVCNSYPSAVIVPRHIEDKIIVLAAKFRDGGRFPVLCYRHDGGSILMRSSQPLSGATGKRCKEDERLLNAVLGPGRRGYIVDTRSASQAQAAKNRGGGTEMDAAYPQWRKVHKAVPRSTDLAESFCKLIEACSDTKCSTSQWLSRLEGSGWLSAIQAALNAACVAAQCLHQEAAAVLVHGGAGRDCTLAVTSLTQAILNPDCRTVRGLQALVEREWLQAGHAFFSRTRHGPYHPPNSQSPAHAPTFLLFLDCLYQLHRQFQFSFEYTTDLLIELYKHAYCSSYGTFLGDSEAERIQLRLSERTASLWSHINQPDVLEKWLNPLYEPNPGVIWPSVAPISIELWMELYLLHTNAAPWKGSLSCAMHIKRKHSAIRKISGQLQSQIRKGIEEIHTNPDSSYGTANAEEHLRLAQMNLEPQST